MISKFAFRSFCMQFLAVFSATLGSISDGMHYGWQSPSEAKLLEPDSRFKVAKEQLYLIDTLFFVGGLISLPLMNYIGDRIGGKPTILITTAVCALSWMLIAFGVNPNFLFIGRFLSGIASGVCFSVVPLYVAEVSHQSIRGFLASFPIIKFALGLVIIYAVGPFLSIQNSALVGVSVPSLQFILMLLMPETPYYLLRFGKLESARKSLKTLRASNHVDEELDEIRLAVERQEQERGSIKDLITDPANRRALLIASTLFISQNIAGFSVMIMNVHTILADSSDFLDVSTSANIFSILMVIFLIIGSATVDKYGRVLVHCVSAAFTALALGLISAFFFVKYHHPDSEAFRSITWLPVVGVVLYATALSFGILIVASVVAGEVFPTSVKSAGIAIVEFSFLATGAVAMQIHRVICDNLGYEYVFLLYSVCTIFVIVFTLKFVPETKGKTLEEIQLMLKKI